MPESIAISSAAGICCCVGLVASLIVPWAGRQAGRSRRAVWSIGLVTAATLSFALSHYTMPRIYNIRLDLVFIPPLIVGTWIHALTVYAASPAAQGRSNRDNTE